MNLSPSFTLEALSASATAVRSGIDNDPPADLLPNGTRLAQGLEEVQKVLGHRIQLDSGYRCEELEKLLTRKDFIHWCALHQKSEDDWPEYFSRKQHPQFKAADFVCPAFGSPAEIVKLLAKSTIQFDQCIQEGTWVHISFAENPRREVLTASFSNGAVSYTKS